MAGTNNPIRGSGLLGLKGTMSKIEGLLEEPGEGARRWRGQGRKKDGKSWLVRN